MKTNRIKELNSIDNDALTVLARCGNATTATLKNIGLSPTRIESMSRDKLIQSIDKNQRYQHKNDESIWSLTPKGKSFVQSNLNIDHCCSGSNASYHNSHVAETYRTHFQREEAVTILIECETRAYVKDRMEELRADDSRLAEYWEWNEKLLAGEMSMPDITVITSSGTIECYEIITGNYTEAEIEAKVTTAEFLDATITKIYI